MELYNQYAGPKLTIKKEPFEDESDLLHIPNLVDCNLHGKDSGIASLKDIADKVSKTCVSEHHSEGKLSVEIGLSQCCSARCKTMYDSSILSCKSVSPLRVVIKPGKIKTESDSDAIVHEAKLVCDGTSYVQDAVNNVSLLAVNSIIRSMSASMHSITQCSNSASEGSLCEKELCTIKEEEGFLEADPMQFCSTEVEIHEEEDPLQFDGVFAGNGAAVVPVSAAVSHKGQGRSAGCEDIKSQRHQQQMSSLLPDVPDETKGSSEGHGTIVGKTMPDASRKLSETSQNEAHKYIISRVKHSTSCEVCNKAFTRKGDLKRHMLIHYNIRPYQCEICNRSFTDKGNLSKHMLIHASIQPFKCEICDRGFTRNSDLKKHTLIHYNIRPFQCEICSKSFTWKSSYNTHKLMHNNIQPFTCSLCSKAFTKKRDLERHMLIHYNIRPFQCELCSQSFTQKGALNSHMLTHENVRPFVCEVCNQSFTRKWNLHTHMLIHANISQFRCEVCSKTFIQKSHLNRHMLVHNNIAPFECDVCHKCFRQRSHLKRHQKTHRDLSASDS